MVRLPIADRLIPIIADPYPDPEKGSGAVKITGAHDFNDFQVAARHDLSMISIMDEQARMAGPIPERYLGCDRYVARKMVVERDRSARPAARDRGPGHRPALRRPLRRGHRALPHRPVVRRRQDPRHPGHRRGGGRPHGLRTEELGEDLFRVDAEHPAVVHLAPAVVGPPHPGLVRTGRPHLRRHDRGGGRRPGPRALRPRRRPCARTRTCWTPGSPPPCGRSPPWAGRSRPRTCAGSTPPTPWSPASTSSSSGSPG